MTHSSIDADADIFYHVHHKIKACLVEQDGPCSVHTFFRLQVNDDAAHRRDAVLTHTPVPPSTAQLRHAFRAEDVLATAGI